MSKKIVKNASWIVACKIVQSILTLIIGMITARYLGPSNYGLINYASSIVAFFTPIMQLGFTSTLIQEFIDNPNSEGTILGTSIIMSMTSAAISIFGVICFSLLANPSETETIVVCILYSFTLIFQASEMTQYWFQSKLLSKYPSIVSLIAYIVVSGYKIFILVSGKNIYWFAFTHAIEAFIITILLIILYRKLGGQKLSFSLVVGKKMISRSKYYISSGIMVVLFQQTDRIMLKLMLNEVETGYYSAAITCIGITGFVFSAVIDSFRPIILESKKQSKDRFLKLLTMLFSIVMIISIAQSLSMTILSKQIILLLFGDEFLPSIQVLRVAVWYVTFGYMGVVRNIWILAENKQKYLGKINLFGALFNVFCNYILIPNYGACGAAAASFLTQFFTNFVLCFVIKPIRQVGFLIIDSLRCKTLIEYAKNTLNKK